MKTKTRSIVGFPNYLATEDGHIFSKARFNFCGHKNSKPQSLLERVLKGRPNKKGYLSVILYGKNKKGLRVHRIVWEAFNGKIPDDMEINHINVIKTDNRLSNLECITHIENIRHAESMGLITRKRGEDNKASKLSGDDIHVIRLMKCHGYKIKYIADSYSVHKATIQRILNGKTWNHI